MLTKFICTDGRHAKPCISYDKPCPGCLAECDPGCRDRVHVLSRVGFFNSCELQEVESQ
jgi:hypothetical protein